MVEDTDEQSGMVTSLVSSFIPNDVYGYCFTFFYSLSGDEEAQLRVRTRRVTGNTTVWSLTGDQGSEWLYAQVGTRSHSTHQMFFPSGISLYCYLPDKVE